MRRVSLALLVMCLTACASPIALTGSRGAPGARGTVKAATGDNGNTRVTIVVEHLPPPDKLVEGSTAYVVWVQNIDHVAPAQNVGTLKVDDDLQGKLVTLTPLHTFDITITPETSAQVAQPSGQPVMSARVEMVD